MQPRQGRTLDPTADQAMAVGFRGLVGALALFTVFFLVHSMTLSSMQASVNELRETLEVHADVLNRLEREHTNAHNKPLTVRKPGRSGTTNANSNLPVTDAPASGTVAATAAATVPAPKSTVAPMRTTAAPTKREEGMLAAVRSVANQKSPLRSEESPHRVNPGGRSGWGYLPESPPLNAEAEARKAEMRKAGTKPMLIPPSVEEEQGRIYNLLIEANEPKLALMWNNTWANTLSTATKLLDDGTTWVHTGDIAAMWLRDSAAQVDHFLSLTANGDIHMQMIVEGLIQRQAIFINHAPYANAFHDYTWPPAVLQSSPHMRPQGRQGYVFEHKYEIDSLCYFISLSYKYWRYSGVSTIFTPEWRAAAATVLQLWRKEQFHDTTSPKTYIMDVWVANNLQHKVVKDAKYTFYSLPLQGQGDPVKQGIGLTWSAFRPSDDECKYHYLIPSNMFAVVACRYIGEICDEVTKDSEMAVRARQLEKEIDEGIHAYGVQKDPRFGLVYAYEVDGYGRYNMMDDANVPSLLSIPYLNYSSPFDPNGVIADNTRNFVLSLKNPYFAQGSVGTGIGSPHTVNSLWPMSVSIRGLTAVSVDEMLSSVDMVAALDGGTGFVHESVDPNNPRKYTRHWFCWANSLYAHLIREALPHIIARGGRGS